MRPRSADRLAALVSDWLGLPVKVRNSPAHGSRCQRISKPASGWGMTAPGDRLGIDAAIGDRLGPQARIVLRIGPLLRAEFEACCRTSPRFVGWCRWSVPLSGSSWASRSTRVLAAREVPPLRLDPAAEPPPRLGWNTWIPGPAGGSTARSDAADAVFEAEVIEAQTADGRRSGTGSMSGWGGGYVTDITYMTGYYRHQSPSMLSLACLLGSVPARCRAPDDRAELPGTGLWPGLGALLLAASNPRLASHRDRFQSRAYRAGARMGAPKPGWTTSSSWKPIFRHWPRTRRRPRYPGRRLVSLHGVWSWVPPRCRTGIVRLLRDKVEPGGIVHVSYNALPAWGPALGLQRLLREGGQRLHAGRSDEQAVEGRSWRRTERRRRLSAARSHWLKYVIERSEQLPAQYLAHEYMNEAWAPCFHADVAKAMAGAKLDGSRPPIWRKISRS